MVPVAPVDDNTYCFGPGPGPGPGPGAVLLLHIKMGAIDFYSKYQRETTVSKVNIFTADGGQFSGSLGLSVNGKTTQFGLLVMQPQEPPEAIVETCYQDFVHL